jgi:hypothetical protein
MLVVSLPFDTHRPPPTKNINNPPDPWNTHMGIMSIMQSFLLFLVLEATGNAWLLDPPCALRARPTKAVLSSKNVKFTTTTLPTQANPRAEQGPATELFTGKLIVSDAVTSSEIATLRELILEYTSISLPTVEEDVQIVELPREELAPGVTGRVAMVEIPSLSATNIGDETLAYWQVVLSQQMDEILYNPENDCLRQPILLSFAAAASDDPSILKDRLVAMIQEQIEGYGLVDPVQNHHLTKEWSSFNSAITFIPSLRYEVDGATVKDGLQDESIWDTSSVLVFDELVSADLRRRMLEVVLGQGGEHWDDANDGPDPSRWSEGGLIDLPEEGEEDTLVSDDSIPVSYGLTDEALEEICQDDPVPTAFEEFEKILVALFDDVAVTRLPEAVLGAEVTPLTANAPCYGQCFNDHIDADPFFAPPSPWTDVFGRYANRATGKPRFVSCLVYLNDQWDASEWGAPTRFFDVATETAVDISPKPGRVVVMDQDVTHTVVAPLKAAGKCPRYSLVWKLVLHPKVHNQDMRRLAGTHHAEWPEAVFIGSAKR